MTPDIKLNGTSVASMGWLRETISFQYHSHKPIRLWYREEILPFVIQKLWGVYPISLGAFL